MARAKQPLNPFTAHDIAGARAVIDSGHDVLELIAKCHRCGMEFEAVADQAKALIAFAEGVVKEFAEGVDANA